MEDIIEYFQDSVSWDDLHLLLTDHEAWESFMAEANLSREEADVLHAGLCELEADLCMEGRERIQRDHLEERFLNEYPRLKRELKGQIRKLHKLADKVDKVHRGCTISNIVASSTGTMSGVLTILGLSLAPVASGISLSLLATGVGLRTASAVTTVSSSIVEYSSTLSAEAKARRLAPAGDNRGETIAKALCQNTPRMFSVTNSFVRVLRNIGKNVRAIRLAKASPHLAAHAKRFMTAGRASVRSDKRVKKVFGGTVLAMIRGARIMDVGTVITSLLVDVANLVEESKHLHQGAKAESAERLRQQAQLLESKLKELNRMYASLK
ncbi:apolipoprotein L2 [Felis catus]|uniref:Apolipoprotein L2-like n=1 Tax=Felis catus TaxID=9685 RepID=A0ABI7YW75_FELCA|nr:apolipoprotein L2 [Felis catus]XP_044918246.1 apolipoprotein L2 [Felis catus]XP_044918247.1 apolipoprotein L2 [Felis catus]XP_044918248.1 apolipoprotein L2 [Felis catus]XP_044918249.1 apolipoprotein L2 [Felis catus]XP_044918250.1 apolipoprotein L2 [Felis catus]XP_044918251.1 apolipoprotein L2 [Felis catus]